MSAASISISVKPLSVFLETARFMGLTLAMDLA
jgi:hypothetical protein